MYYFKQKENKVILEVSICRICSEIRGHQFSLLAEFCVHQLTKLGTKLEAEFHLLVIGMLKFPGLYHLY
jgi:hypothetical protein